MGVSGDFAVAYVIAHEVGHHVQNVIGTERKFRQYQSQAGSQEQANALSVLMELQADCYAGVWANHAHSQRQLLEEGDVEEGLNAAAAIGDDRMQRMAGRRVNPDGFTHGSSQQRVQWFRTGMQSGDIKSCDTFGQAGL
jgi:predicted metalloprotease